MSRPLDNGGAGDRGIDNRVVDKWIAVASADTGKQQDSRRGKDREPDEPLELNELVTNGVSNEIGG
jgi:hypothetical protein